MLLSHRKTSYLPALHRTDKKISEMNFTREILHDRHRLSHQQIDSLLSEKNNNKEYLSEKLKQFKSIQSFLIVTDLLVSKGIKFICLKGPLLSYRIYRDPSVRLYHDTDILIDEDMIEPVITILTENGFHLMDITHWPGKKIQRDLIIKNDHHLAFFSSQLNFCVEVHWTLMQPLPISPKNQKIIIAENVTETSFAGRNFTVLNKEVELIYLLIHGALHAWCRLKWLIDIKDYPVNEVNEKKFNQLILQFNAGRIIGQANYLLRQFFNVQLPFRGNNYVPRYLINYSLQNIEADISEQNTTINIICKLWYDCLLFRGFKYKLKRGAVICVRPNDVLYVQSSFKVIYYLYRIYGFFLRRILHKSTDSEVIMK